LYHFHLKPLFNISAFQNLQCSLEALLIMNLFHILPCLPEALVITSILQLAPLEAVLVQKLINIQIRTVDKVQHFRYSFLDNCSTGSCFSSFNTVFVWLEWKVIIR